MSDPITFFVSMIPRQKNQLRAFKIGGFARVVPGKDTQENQATLASLMAPYRPSVPFSCPVRVHVMFVMPIPLGWPEWKKLAAREGCFHHVSRPDRGNLLKLLEDALTGPFLADDSLIVGGLVEKSYGDVPGYGVTLTPLPQATKPERVAKAPRAKKPECVAKAPVSQGPIAVVETPLVREALASSGLDKGDGQTHHSAGGCCGGAHDPKPVAPVEPTAKQLFSW